MLHRASGRHFSCSPAFYAAPTKMQIAVVRRRTPFNFAARQRANRLGSFPKVAGAGRFARRVRPMRWKGGLMVYSRQALSSLDAKNRERRRYLRVRTLKAGVIRYTTRPLSTTCIIRNLSPAGALLEVFTQAGVPHQFSLQWDSGRTARDCRVVWRYGSQVGVEFRTDLPALTC
jgi:hypothetical protein